MPRMNSELRDPTFESVVIGEEIGPVEKLADEHFARQGSFAIGDYADWYTTGRFFRVVLAQQRLDQPCLYQNSIPRRPAYGQGSGQ